MPYLIQKNADGSIIQKWDVRQKPLSVGRGEGVDVSLDDKEISHKHCVIVPNDNGCVIQDLNSRNGTWVNNAKITEVTLKPNDHIRIGQSHLIFVEGLTTVMGKLEKGDTGYSTYVREISRKSKR